MIKSDMLYELEELKTELKWTDHAYRKARKQGLKITLFSGHNYVLGKHAIEFITKQELDQRQLQEFERSMELMQKSVEALKELSTKYNFDTEAQ